MHLNAIHKAIKKEKDLSTFQRQIINRVNHLELSKKKATRTIQEQVVKTGGRRNPVDIRVLEKSLSSLELPVEALPNERSYSVYPDEGFKLTDTYFIAEPRRPAPETDKLEKELVNPLPSYSRSGPFTGPDGSTKCVQGKTRNASMRFRCRTRLQIGREYTRGRGRGGRGRRAWCGGSRGLRGRGCRRWGIGRRVYSRRERRGSWFMLN